GHLRWLQVVETQIDPARTAVDDTSNARHQHQRQQQEGQQQQESAVGVPGAHRQMQRHDYHPESQHREKRLAFEEEERVAILSVGNFHRRGGHHQQADGHQQQHHHQQYIDSAWCLEFALDGPQCREGGSICACAHSASTAAANTRPRCMKLSNMSKLAHAGDNSTASPALARVAAIATASSMEPAATVSVKPWNAATSLAASLPIRMATTTKRSTAGCMTVKSDSLSSPPAISRMRPLIISPILSMATSAAPTLVPLESL